MEGCLIQNSGEHNRPHEEIFCNDLKQVMLHFEFSLSYQWCVVKAFFFSVHHDEFCKF